MSHIEAETETMAASSSMPTKSDTEQNLMAQAVAAARAFPKGERRLPWSEALKAAPWPEWGPPAWEGEFRAAFARELVKRKMASPVYGRVPAAGAGRNAPRPRGTEPLIRRPLSGTKQEFKRQDALAAAAGVSWASWARRKLAE